MCGVLAAWCFRPIKGLLPFQKRRIAAPLAFGPMIGGQHEEGAFWNRCARALMNVQVILDGPILHHDFGG